MKQRRVKVVTIQILRSQHIGTRQADLLLPVLKCGINGLHEQEEVKELREEDRAACTEAKAWG